MTDPTKLRLDLPLVLTGIEGACDRCVARLIDRLQGRAGIAEAHIVEPYGPARAVHPLRPGHLVAGQRA